MSQHHRSAARRPHHVPGHFSSNPELHEQLARFQAAAQDLLFVYEQGEAAEPPAEPHPKNDSRRASELGGEIRSFYFSPALLRHEHELLRKHHAADLPALLAEIHMLLNGVLKLMKNAQPDARVRGCVLVSLGHLLEQVCVLALRLRGVYGRAERIER